ncbi:MAG TPA: tRNA pseudouridine(38-40) synthase TruA [Steroidobacteraceae bacterium]|nr:tRNA pseudouridine(38-40) synthase TruA [Steroidobacteraceae bacterium]
MTASGAEVTGRRVAAVVEYDGTDYAGWQSQEHSASIQDAVQAAISFVAGHPIVAICAGRTDSGVHATGQVIHFDTDAVRTPRAWVLGSNTKLSPAIALQWAGEVTFGFHARHQATRRIYRYCILNRSARSALQRMRAAWIHRPLNEAAMHAAAQALIGEHDFSAFRSAECQSKTTVRRVDRIEVRREGDYLWLEIAANAYLHHMVRNIVGTLLAVQSESDPAAAMTAVLTKGNRRFAGATAPAAGLYLWRVEYPAVYRIPSPQLAPWSGPVLPPAGLLG